MKRIVYAPQNKRRIADVPLSKRQLQVLLAHPGGPFYKNKDNGFWTIPKGEIAADEVALDAAVREFTEETGITPRGEFIPLGSVKQKERQDRARMGVCRRLG